MNDQTIPAWTIYYHDGTTFSSDDGGPEESPGHKGILAIVISDGTVGYRVMHGGSPHFGQGFYWFEKGIWFVGNQQGVSQYLSDPGWKVVRLGRMVLEKEWHDMWDRIDRDFGRKDSYWSQEPRRERVNG